MSTSIPPKEISAALVLVSVSGFLITVTSLICFFLPIVAVIVTLPVLIPYTVPFSTVAIFKSLESHLTSSGFTLVTES